MAHAELVTTVLMSSRACPARSRPTSAAVPHRAFPVLAISLVLALASSCGGDSGSDSGTGTEPSSPASTRTDPLAEPSVEGKYAVTPGGRELALVCWGDGSPLVLLETGGTNLEEWTGSGLVRELAGTTRVCTYDRAGTGASDPAPNERRDADDVVTEGDAALEAAGLTGPRVLLGRSFGGMIVTHFAQTRPEDVGGVVVLDTPAPSAEFTEETAPELAWDAPGNTEHLDVVTGFENRFAKDPPSFDAPLLVVSPVPGEASPANERFWLQTSPRSRQVTCSGEPDAGGPCAEAVAQFIDELDLSS